MVSRSTPDWKKLREALDVAAADLCEQETGVRPKTIRDEFIWIDEEGEHVLATEERPVTKK